MPNDVEHRLDALALIVVAECVSWYGVVTANYLGSAIENSIWAVAFAAIAIGLGRLLPDFHGPVRMVSPSRSSGSQAICRFSRPSTSRCTLSDGGRNCRRRQAAAAA